MFDVMHCGFRVDVRVNWRPYYGYYAKKVTGKNKVTK